MGANQIGPGSISMEGVMFLFLPMPGNANAIGTLLSIILNGSFQHDVTAVCSIPY
jgi:hypothetical protein